MRLILVAAPLLGLLVAGCAQRTAALDTETTPSSSRAVATSTSTSNEPFTLGGSWTYVYYPSAQAYYAPDRQLWFWRGAEYWGMGSTLPASVDLGDEAREIELDTARPFHVHEHVAAIFDDGTSVERTAGVPTDH